MLASASLRIVREYQRLVVFRLAEWWGSGPRRRVLIPFVDRALSADLREIYLRSQADLYHQDNAP